MRIAVTVMGGLLVAVIAASCGHSYSDSASGSSGGSGATVYGPDRSAPETAKPVGPGSLCSDATYSFAATCGSPADATIQHATCSTSFDCAGICCACPLRDAGPDDAGDGGQVDADSGAPSAPAQGFRVFACECGTCSEDLALCSRMLAGNPSLCP